MRDECEHGTLRRKCLACELTDEVAALRAEVATLTAARDSAERLCSEHRNERAKAEALLLESHRYLLDAETREAGDRVAAMAEALLTRRDFWDHAGVLPGEVDDLTEAAAAWRAARGGR
jgi:hypothetical protein